MARAYPPDTLVPRNRASPGRDGPEDLFRTRQGPGALVAAPGPWSVVRRRATTRSAVSPWTSVLLGGHRGRVGRLGGGGAGHGRRGALDRRRAGGRGARLGRDGLDGGGLGRLRGLDGLLGGGLRRLGDVGDLGRLGSGLLRDRGHLVGGLDDGLGGVLEHLLEGVLDGVNGTLGPTDDATEGGLVTQLLDDLGAT